jgi:hypothetical protein
MKEGKLSGGIEGRERGKWKSVRGEWRNVEESELEGGEREMRDKTEGRRGDNRKCVERGRKVKERDVQERGK